MLKSVKIQLTVKIRAFFFSQACCNAAVVLSDHHYCDGWLDGNKESDLFTELNEPVHV